MVSPTDAFDMFIGICPVVPHPDPPFDVTFAIANTDAESVSTYPMAKQNRINTA
jgi:hypothetical protein